MNAHHQPTAAFSRRGFVLGSVGLAVLAGCAVPAQTAADRADEPTQVLEELLSSETESSTSAVDRSAETAAVTPEESEEASEVSHFEVSHTDDEWHALLTDEQYDVLRDAGTEIPYSSPLNDEHGSGVFSCAGCALDLFSSTAKFDSGTGWPSFWAVMDDAVLEIADSSMGMTRTEVLCRRCGGHLGHVFDDGPEPTGLRYCMNGVALIFTPDQ